MAEDGGEVHGRSIMSLPLSTTTVVKSVISLFSHEFCKLLSILFADFFKAGYHFEGKILKPGEKVIPWSACPRTI